MGGGKERQGREEVSTRRCGKEGGQSGDSGVRRDEGGRGEGAGRETCSMPAL